MGDRLLLRVVQGVGALVVVFVLAIGYQLWSIRSDLKQAETRLDGISLESTAAGEGIESLATPVLDPIRDADRRANGALLSAAGHLPVLGDQIEGLRDLTGNLSGLADAADDQLDVIDAAFARASTPEGTVALADALIEVTEALQEAVASVPEVDDTELLGPLKTASRQLDDALERGAEKLDELHGYVSTGRDVLVGPTDVLVLAANNAEHRAGMGMHLSAGVVTIEKGEFSTTEFAPTEVLTAFTEGRAEYPAELEPVFEQIWDYGHEWRTVSSTPNFPVVGSIFDQLAELVGYGEVDAVVSVDALALAGLLQATGPLEVEGQDVRADNVIDLLLRDNYLDFTGGGAENQERRELQGEIASTIFEALTESQVDPLELASELAEAAKGRHLLAWADEPSLQVLWETLGADGSLTPESLLIATQNATGSKRDYYLDPTMSVQALDDDRPDVQRYRAVATLPNPVVEPTAPVVEGTNPLVPPGVHRAYVTFTLPGAATDIEFVAGRPSRQGTDGPTKLAAAWLRVPVSETGSAAIEFDLPMSVREIDLLPSARLRPVEYTIGARTVLDDVTKQVRLPYGPIPDRSPKYAQALGLTLAFAGLLVLVARSRRLSAPEPDLAAARTDLLIGTAFALIGIGALVIASV